MAGRIVTVFGGTGFLGRRVVRHLGSQGLSVRIAPGIPSARKNSGIIERDSLINRQRRRRYARPSSPFPGRVKIL